MLIEYDVLTNKTSAASEATTHRCVVRLCTIRRCGAPRAAIAAAARRGAFTLALTLPLLVMKTVLAWIKLLLMSQ
jgi:hypothetical protein